MTASGSINRALISVSDKRALLPFASSLVEFGIELLSTGGTARALREAGLPVTDVASVTGFPEIMGGRVKTLHPSIHGAILGRRGVDEAVMAEHGIQPIDLVVVNLYPFEDTIAAANVTREAAIEQIDIGGPAMVRAAAKNHADVAVVVSPDDYDSVIEAIGENKLDLVARRQLAARAYAHTAAYDAAIAGYLCEEDSPPQYARGWALASALRYGENPHQKAAFYRERDARQGTIGGSQVLQGKALSYNNLADADAALRCVRDFDEPTVVIVKHANPCGVATAADLGDAYDRAFGCDPQSAFGGIIAINRPLDADLATQIIDRQFVEVILAPEVSDAAKEVLKRKRNVRVLATGSWASATPDKVLKWVSGGMLVQDQDLGQPADLNVASKRQPSPAELTDMRFLWRVMKHVKSNAIVIGSEQCAFGIGAGQMSRVMSVRIAAARAQESEFAELPRLLASDAFFPFADGIEEAAKAGVTGIIQPGGSKRDAEVIAAADAHGMAMVLTGMRHFNH